MSEGTAVVFQEGDRVKHEYYGEVDYGVITKKDGSIYTSYGNIWAFWENTNMLENAAPRFLTLIERKKVHEPNLNVVFQEGDRVKYKYEDTGEVIFGTVVKKSGAIFTPFGNIWVLWDNTGRVQYARPHRLTLILRKGQPKPMPKHVPHKYAGVIKHWADGGEIQFKYQGSTNWETYAFIKSFPYVDSPEHIWRIKPEVKSISYRVGITKDNQIKVYHEEPTLDDAYGSDAFKDWLDPEWRFVEVEV